MYHKASEACANVRVNLLALLLGVMPAVSTAGIIWDGHFNDHNFLAYHRPAPNQNEVAFFHIPAYGRPIQYGFQHPLHVGNGDLLSLESSPTRGSSYSAKFTVKNSANGVEPDDCDPDTDCANRRSQLQMTSTFLDYYNAIPYGAERWLSFSIFLPTDFDSSGSSWGSVIWGSKSSLQNKPGAFGVQVQDGEWNLVHRYYSERMHVQGINAGQSWWLSVRYTPSFPSSSNWAQGLVDFPNEAASKAALANLNKGGWTDFIWHFRTDVSDFDAGNNGFLDVWMRAGSGPWVQVLGLRPMKDLARSPSWPDALPERVYDRGIGQYGPGGYTSTIGLYMDKDRVWRHSKNMSIYMDNIKVGDENATFSDMSPDGSGNFGESGSGGGSTGIPMIVFLLVWGMWREHRRPR